MDPFIAAVLRRQGGLVRADQLGPQPGHLREVVAATGLVRVRRGVYASHARVAAAVTPEDRQRLADDAACLVIGVEAVRSHSSAALVHGMQLIRSSRPATHLTAGKPQAWRRRGGVVLHVASYGEEDVSEVGGIRCLSMPRTALDIARSEPLRAGVVACDAALRLGATSLDLARETERMSHWPGIRRGRRAVELSDPGSDSPGETLARLMVIELGHGLPETQFGLTDGTTTAFADLRLGRHLIEFDGKVKYSGAYGDGAEAVWAEKVRQDFLMSFRLGMTRLVWDDLFRNRTAALARLEADHQATCRLFGTAIEDLAPFRAYRSRRSSSAAS